MTEADPTDAADPTADRTDDTRDDSGPAPVRPVWEWRPRLEGLWWPGPAVIAVTLVVAMWVGRRLWFFSDDWNIMTQWPSGRLLDPFNSHLSLVPVGVYQALFHTVGVGSYLPYRIVGLIAYAALGAVTWRYARSRVGAVGGAIATAAVLWNSGGVTNVMFPFLMNFSLPVAALAAAWWHLDRATDATTEADLEVTAAEPAPVGVPARVAGFLARPGVRHEVWASVWLCLALATSGLGLMVAVALGVELVWRRPPWRRWAILAPGPVLWLAWYAFYGVESPAAGGLRPIVSYSVRMLLGGFGSFVGGERWLAVGVVIVYGALVVSAMYRHRFDGRVAGALGAAAAFVVLTSISRIGVVPSIPPDELRYQWTVGAFLVLAAVPMVGPLPERVPGALRVLAAALAVGTLVNAGLLVDSMRDWAHTVEAAAPGIRDNLWVAERSAGFDQLNAGRLLPVSYVSVSVADYIAGIRSVGSPIDGAGPDEFGGSADSRNNADAAYLDDAGVAVVGVLGDNPQYCGADPQRGPVRAAAADGPWLVQVTATEPVTISVAMFGDGTEVGEMPAGIGIIALPELPGAPFGDYRITTSAPSELVLCRE